MSKISTSTSGYALEISSAIGEARELERAERTMSLGDAEAMDMAASAPSPPSATPVMRTNRIVSCLCEHTFDERRTAFACNQRGEFASYFVAFGLEAEAIWVFEYNSRGSLLKRFVRCY